MQALTRRTFAAAIPAATTALIGGIRAARVMAAAADYRFDLAKTKPIEPGKTDVIVRLLHVADGKPVAGAVIFVAKVHMGPSGMEEMAGKVAPLAATQPGEYRFRTETDMPGTWALTLSAKVQGEAQTVSGTVNFDVAE